MISLAVIMFYVLMALVGAAYDVGGAFFGQQPFASLKDYAHINEPPSLRSFWTILGTDWSGRSVLLKTMLGAKVSLSVGLVSNIIAVPLGMVLGALAGFYHGKLMRGGWVDDAIVMVYSTLASIPGVILLVAMKYALKGRTLFGQQWLSLDGISGVYIAIAAVAWVGTCRLVRAEVMKIRELDYVTAARAIGASDAAILLRHVLPNVLHIGIINFSLGFVGAIGGEVILSYLNLGVAVGTPSWGTMINGARMDLLAGRWWELTSAVTAMFFLVLALNIFGDRLRDALDPGDGLRFRSPRRLPVPASGQRGILIDDNTAQPVLLEKPVLRLRNLRTSFATDNGVVKAVDGVSLSIGPGKTLAIIGESGCGKSQIAFSIMRIVSPPGQFAADVMELEGTDLMALPEKEMRRIRGAKISMIFQEPAGSLNPVYTCGSQIVEAINLHRKLHRRTARKLAIEMLAKVGIPDPHRCFAQYPHQLSGGMAQRVMIAMAISCGPRLLIADEPTSSLDAIAQAQILALLKNLQKTGLSMLLITHDIAVAAQTAGAVAVMYASKIVEHGDAKSVLAAPLHPYTRGLLRSMPRPGIFGKNLLRLEAIPGTVPNGLDFPDGCKFHPRCPSATPQCAAQEPQLNEVSPCRWCACWQIPAYKNTAATDPRVT
jgi:peptide/nickel transport system permease protein